MRLARSTLAKIACAVALVLSTISACSREPESAGKPKSDKTAPSSGAPQQATVVRVWHTELDKEAQRVLQEIMDEFAKAHPGVKMEQEGIPWGQLNQKLVASFVSGDVPDLVHLQPFMAASLYRRGQLQPLDDVYAAIGADDVFPAVRDLQLFDGKRYGIAYAVGNTFWAVRKDLLAQASTPNPTTWSEFAAAAAQLTARNSDGNVTHYGVMLPGDPFFIDQLSCELIASNGGHLFDDAGKPDFTQRQVVEMLTFWRDIAKYAPPNWSSATYLDQFKLLAAGKVSMVPVTYARALKNIKADAPKGTATPEVFGFIPAPIGPSGTTGYTTLDCEPWAILKGAKHADIAQQFLVFLYDAPNYVRFCQSVPIHLTPTRISVATGAQYQGTPFVKEWQSWQDRTNAVLNSPQALPILFNRPEDRNLPYLMELNGERIITDAVIAVAIEGKDPVEAAKEAQAKAMALLARVGFKDDGRP